MVDVDDHALLVVDHERFHVFVELDYFHWGHQAPTDVKMTQC